MRLANGGDLKANIACTLLNARGVQWLVLTQDARGADPSLACLCINLNVVLERQARQRQLLRNFLPKERILIEVSEKCGRILGRAILVLDPISYQRAYRLRK